MKLRILESVAGESYSVCPGEERDDLSDAVAYDLLSAGYAELIEVERVETAVLPAPEVAVTRGRGRRRRNGAKPDAA